MIGYLEGKIIKQDGDRILLLSGAIGFEVLLPTIVMNSLSAKPNQEKISFYIYYHQTERQPKPILIGFNLDIEREFFHQFISVEDIGPMKAVQALCIPISDIAKAIEEKDIKKLTQLKGIGNRTAQKIIASLHGKMNKYLMHQEELNNYSQTDTSSLSDNSEYTQQVYNVLVTQLGHRPAEAKQLIHDALQRNQTIKTPEALLEEIYRGES